MARVFLAPYSQKKVRTKMQQMMIEKQLDKFIIVEKQNVCEKDKKE